MSESLVSLLLTLLPGLACIVGLIRFRQLDKFFKYILLWLCYDALDEILSYKLKHFVPYGNSILYDFFILFQGLSLTLIGLMYVKNIHIKRAVYVGNVLFIGVWSFCVYTAPYLFQTLALIVSGLIIVMEYLYILVDKAWESDRELIKNSMFWLPLAMVIFFVGIIPYFGFMNYLNLHYQKSSDNLFYIIYTLNILYYSFISIAFILNKKEN